MIPGGAGHIVDSDLRLLESLRNGEEEAFVSLLDCYHASLLRVARTFVQSHAVAEEVVQETWLGVVRGIDRFEGRSSLRTWLLAILVNRARRAGSHEARTLPISEVEDFATTNRSQFDVSRRYSAPFEPWTEEIEERIDAVALRKDILSALAEMPARQRAVVILRDVHGLRSDETCAVLGLTAANERVLLHRARGRLRRMLEDSIND